VSTSCIAGDSASRAMTCEILGCVMPRRRATFAVARHGARLDGPVDPVSEGELAGQSVGAGAPWARCGRGPTSGRLARSIAHRLHHRHLGDRRIGRPHEAEGDRKDLTINDPQEDCRPQPTRLSNSGPLALCSAEVLKNQLVILIKAHD
jgi:hypothetical protein